MPIAFATIAADPKTFKQLAAGTNAIVDGCGYLLVSDGFANTDVHLLISDGEKVLCK